MTKNLIPILISIFAFAADNASSQCLVELTALNDSAKKYDFIGEFCNGRAMVTLGNEYRYIDTTGRLSSNSVIFDGRIIAFGEELSQANREKMLSARESLGSIADGMRRDIYMVIDEYVNLPTDIIPVAFADNEFWYVFGKKNAPRQQKRL